MEYSKNLFILDIETKPNINLIDTFKSNIKPKANTKDPAKIQAQIEAKMDNAHKAMSVDPDYCDIVCIGIKQVGAYKANVIKIEELPLFFEAYSDAELVTFNGRSFDIPAIIKAGIRLNLDFPFKKLLDMTKKYNPKCHYDLQDILSFSSGMDNVKSLNSYLKIYLGIEKETEGDDFFRNATDDERRKHCAEDLVFTEQLLNKFLFLIN